MPVFYKRLIFFLLSVLFAGYSLMVYIYSADDKAAETKHLNEKAKNGKLVFQKYNCIACHQLYGLGGYMGPDLTNVMSEQNKGELYVKAFLLNGTNKMPNFHMSDEEIEAVVAFLNYVDKTGTSPVRDFKTDASGLVDYK